MNKRKLQIITIFFSLFFIYPVFSQENGFIEDFNDNSLDTIWFTEFEQTFQLEESDSILKITYTRTAASAMWDQFNLTLDSIDASENPFISVDVKSDIQTVLTFKPQNSSGVSDWQLMFNIPGDNLWHHYVFALLASSNAPLVKIWMYLDAGSSTLVSGLVSFDNLRIGDDALIFADTASLNFALSKANLLIINSEAGTNPGEFPNLTFDRLQNTIDSANAIYSDYTGQYSYNFVDSLTNFIYDECMLFESGVIYEDSISLIDSLSTLQTKLLCQNLKVVASSNQFMFGMHDALGYGVGWRNNNRRSDVKDVCGSFPAVFSWDASAVINGTWDDINDKISFSYNEGGVQTLCWHQNDPLDRGFYQSDVGYKVVDSILQGGAYHEKYKESLVELSRFAKQIRDEKGRSIPIIFRPYHEHNGNWFWWGKGNCTELQYKELWQFTVNYLRDTLGVHNFIYAFSPDGHQYNTKSQYLYGYPGDDFVDILGMDFYFGDIYTATVTKLADRLKHAIEYSNEKNKIAALTETGDRKDWDDDDMLEIPNWFTKHLLAAIKNINVNYKIAYASVWRNESTTHHFAPYLGHHSAPDFQDFYGDTSTIFLNDKLNMFDSIIEPGDLNFISDACFLTTFDIEGSINTVFNRFTITVNIPDSISVSSLIPEFTTTLFSTAKVGSEIQTSGVNIHDFSDAIQYIVYAQNGTDSSIYTVKVQLIPPSDISELNIENILVYPNPSSGKLKVVYSGTIENISIFNISGTIVKILEPLDQKEITLDISNLIEGVYYLRIQLDENKFLIKKIIKN